MFLFAGIPVEDGYQQHPALTAFVNRFTDRSRAKLLEGFNSTRPEVFADHYRLTTRYRRLRYVMDLDPVYIVFYSSSGAAAYDALLYDFVLKNPEGEFRMTNVGFASSVDSLFHWTPVEIGLLSLINTSS